MTFRLPTREQKRWITNGYNPYNAFLERTVNVDLNTKPGRVRTTRLKKVNTVDDIDGVLDPFMPVSGFRYYGFDYYAISSDSNVLINDGGNPDSAWEVDNSSPIITSVNPQAADIELAFGSLYVSDEDEISKLTSSTWSTPITGLTTDTPTLLERFSDKVYYTDNNLFVGSFNSSDAKSTGTATLDLTNFFINTSSLSHRISMLEGANNQLWIGTINNGNDPAYVLTWNGETEDTFTASYRLNSSGVLAGVIQKETNSPFIFTVEGRLLQFNGAGFTEVARLPLGSAELDTSTYTGSLHSGRAVHKNGMIDKDGEILILINTRVWSGDHKAPSGVWAYSKDTGFYHKYSVSQQDIDDDGTTNMIDYGQTYPDDNRFAGALYNAYERATDTANGSLLIGAAFYTDDSTRKFGIFTDDTDDNTQKQGAIITSWMESDGIDDVWTDLVAKHKRLLNSADEIDVKYRLEDLDGVTSDVVFSSSRTFNTADSDYATVKENFDDGVGYDVQFLLGNNAGMHVNITDIVDNGGSYTVTIDQDLLVSNGTSKALTENWKSIKKQTSQKEQLAWGKVGDYSTKLQAKVVMKWTGKNELDEVFVDNNPRQVS